MDESTYNVTHRAAILINQSDIERKIHRYSKLFLSRTDNLHHFDSEFLNGRVQF